MASFIVGVIFLGMNDTDKKGKGPQEFGGNEGKVYEEFMDL